MKDKSFLLVGLVIIFGSFYLFLQKPAPAHYQTNLAVQQLSTLEIGEKIIAVEIADTDAKRSLGLSGRPSLAEGEGMLFVFPESGNYGFWMKDMNFPIDIIWIDESWKIAGVKRLVNPDTYPEVFYPSDNIKYVLEIGAGEAQKYGIDIGQFVSYLQ